MFAEVCAATMVLIMEMADFLQIPWIFQSLNVHIRNNKTSAFALLLVRRFSVLKQCIRNALTRNVITNIKMFYEPFRTAEPPLDDAAKAFFIDCMNASTHNPHGSVISVHDESNLKCYCVGCNVFRRHKTGDDDQ
jgi:hypothetical protein